MNRYVVEDVARDAEGKYAGTIRVWVGTEERAREIASQAPGRTWREATAQERDKGVNGG